MELWILGSTLVLLAIASWTDLKSMRIPNALTAGFAAGGLLFHLIWMGWQGLLTSLVGGLAGAIPILVVYRFGGIGAGDVKWFGAYGTWSGAAAALQLLAVSILIGGAISVLLLTLRIRWFRRLGSKLPWPWGKHPARPGRGAVFPFMIAVAPGYVWLQIHAGTII